MTVAIVCIAKDEDNYIKEWINYHLSIGFSKIYVYQNDWNFDITNYNNVEVIKITGCGMQLPVYNSFIETKGKNYDFVAFFDVDEFLNSDNLNWLETYSQYKGVGINWKIFGDSFIEKIQSFSVLDRFIMSERGYDPHTKLILNMNKIKKEKFINPHYLNDMSNIVNINFKPIQKDINPITSNEKNIYLAHYRIKSKEEFINKMKRGWPVDKKIGTLSMWHFNTYNKNEVYNFDLYSRVNNLSK